ncbi:hypothetical protein [Nocardia macrotermitis]|uniref:Uncharacterized protein n=1 Tax=Nocardia macrotermitis TaxID=2585198 RepID=A0A7K0D9L6_9NOCA|nr:hypothetical protein [Nocardia macrotermitis]MQY22453.1 hypothetical protein [Nocardia macrotermitis]
MSANKTRAFEHVRAAKIEADAIDAVIDIRSRRRCVYERSGMDPVSLAVHAWAETGHVPGWDNGIDYEDTDFDGGWAA